MEDQVTRLVDKAWDLFQKAPTDRRFMIGIAGIPGSGKTTLSQIVTKELNKRHATLHPEIPEAIPVAAFVPMDGYHLYRSQLDLFDDPKFAHDRRGAHFTFDGPKFLALVKSLRDPLTASSPIIYAPSFDHAKKDPEEDAIQVLPGHRIIVFEGNYVALNQSPWKEAAELMDQLWFVDVDFGVAKKRLIRRHVEAGIAKDEEEAAKRAEENDLVNGHEIVEKRLPVHEVVVSKEDDAWKHE